VNNPGADDNGSGTAAVMEIARVLSQFTFDATLTFVAFDREEQGCTVRRLTRPRPWREAIRSSGW
jgi:Zn-dependent M28 family amino/carboxypeptidase